MWKRFKIKILKKAFVNYKESGNLRIRNEVEAFKKANKFSNR